MWMWESQAFGGTLILGGSEPDENGNASWAQMRPLPTLAAADTAHRPVAFRISRRDVINPVMISPSAFAIGVIVGLETVELRRVRDEDLSLQLRVWRPIGQTVEEHGIVRLRICRRGRMRPVAAPNQPFGGERDE